MKKALTAKDLALIGLFAALTAILSPLSIPLAFSPIPITLGIVAVYTTGILLPPKHAVLTQLCYLLLGAVGLPVFSGFRGGLPALFGPTGGYLMVYPIMAWIVSVMLGSKREREAERRQGKALLFVKAAIFICIAQLVLYTGGSLWMCATAVDTSFTKALSLAVFPFIPLDLAKIVFCVAAIVPLRLRLMRMNLLMAEAAAKPGAKAETGTP